LKLPDIALGFAALPAMTTNNSIKVKAENGDQCPSILHRMGLGFIPSHSR
jgi:hypothetical protein